MILVAPEGDFPLRLASRARGTGSRPSSLCLLVRSRDGAGCQGAVGGPLCAAVGLWGRAHAAALLVASGAIGLRADGVKLVSVIQEFS